MADLDFDYAAARAAGYTDDDILNGLESHGKLSFDLGAAKKAGYSSSDILDTLVRSSAPKPEEKPEPTSLLRRAGDIGISALKGAIAVPETAIGLADIATGGAAGRSAEALGFRAREAKEQLNELYSPAQKAANQRVAEAKGFLDTTGAILSNPSTIVQTGVESLPSMGAGGVIGRGAMLATLGAGERAALAVLPKAERAGSLGALSKLNPVSAGAIGEGAVGAGQTAEQVRQQTPGGELSLGQSAASLASGIGTGAFAAVGGRIAQKLGISDIDTALVQAGAPIASSKGVARRLAEGAISEGVFEELPQSIQEQIWQNAAMDKPLLEGVGENAAQGLIAGGLFGGIAGAALHGTPHAPPAQEQPGAPPLQLENRPDPFISFPDGSVGRQSDAEAFINGLPEDQRLAARSRMFGYEAQPYTADDVLQAQSVDAAIAVANRAIEEGTPEFRAQRNSEIDSAWNQYLGDRAAQRQQEFSSAEDQRRAAETPQLLNQVADQNVEQAQAATEAQGFDEQQPTTMQLALQQAQQVEQARSILSAAGVTGNERMEALRSIRAGDNTLEDLIDAHPPKPQEPANVTTDNASRVVDVGGRSDSNAARNESAISGRLGTNGSVSGNEQGIARLAGEQSAVNLPSPSGTTNVQPALVNQGASNATQEISQQRRAQGESGQGNRVRQEAIPSGGNRLQRPTGGGQAQGAAALQGQEVARLQLPAATTSWSRDTLQKWETPWTAVKRLAQDGRVSKEDAAKIKMIASGSQVQAPDRLAKLVQEIKRRPAVSANVEIATAPQKVPEVAPEKEQEVGHKATAAAVESTKTESTTEDVQVSTADNDAGEDIPLAFMKKTKIPHEVWVDDEKQYHTANIPADKALASVREDISNLKALLACLKG